MKVLIYSESDLAKEVLAKLREDEQTVSLRNAEFFKASELEVCDLAIVSADDGEIFNAYHNAEIDVKYLENFGQSVAASIKETETEKPKRGKSKAK